MALLLLPLLSLLVVSLSSSSSLAARTFSGAEGYVFYQAWNLNPQRLLRFTFQTSERNGLLVYAPEASNSSSSSEGEGEEMEDHMLIRLVNGSLVINVNLGPLNSEEEIIGEFLNDNRPHTVTVFQDPARFRFQYSLDDTTLPDETYASNLRPVFGTCGLYIGGVPRNATPFANDTRFIGCVRDVLFTSSDGLAITTPTSSLQQLPELKTGGAFIDGCVDPCTGMDCGSGVCVSKWPDNAFCDCRSSMQLGEFCNETNRSMHQLSLCLPPADEGTTHYCYKPVFEPYSGPSNFFTVQLVPPIHSEGVIMVAHAEVGDSFFSLRLEGNRTVFEYDITVGVSAFNLTMDTVLESSGTTYQIDLTTTFNRAELVISSVAANGNEVSELERFDTSDRNGAVIYPESTVFSTVCLGGSLLDYRNYLGTLQSSFFNYNSLLEERTSSILQTEGVARSDTIVFADDETPRSLRFTRLTLRNRFTFQVRHPRTNPRGILFHVENGLYDFVLSTFAHLTLVGIFRDLISQRDVETNFLACSGSSEIVANDEEWHKYEVVTNLDPSEGEFVSLSVIFDDCVLVCQFNSPAYAAPILSLADAPLQFGSAHDFLASNDEVPYAFRGCMSGFEFEESDGSGVFRPNLEAVPRHSSLFNATGCSHCVSKQRTCAGSGEVCIDPGFEEVGRCACPAGFEGSMCQDLSVPPPLDITSGITCPPIPTTTTPTLITTINITTTMNTAACLLPTTSPSTSTSTTADDVTTTMSTADTDVTNATNSTDFPISTPNSNQGRTLGIGLGLGIALLVSIALIALLVACIVYRNGSKIRGFYKTNESSSQETSMIRYSASLRQLSSEIVSTDKDNAEVSWSHKNGHYNNGGAAPVRTSCNDKEFYL